MPDCVSLSVYIRGDEKLTTVLSWSELCIHGELIKYQIKIKSNSLFFQDNAGLVLGTCSSIIVLLK